jgi:hypothetical protein
MAKMLTTFNRDATLEPGQDCWIRVLDFEGNELYRSDPMGWMEASLLQDVMEKLWDEGFKHGLDKVVEVLNDAKERLWWQR